VPKYLDNPTHKVISLIAYSFFPLFAFRFTLFKMSHGPDTDDLIDSIEDSYDSHLLNVSGFDITSLPDLPEDLEELWCNNTQLDTLPDLPSELYVLWCSNTPLTSLPDLPDGLQEIRCYSTQITSLPTLPEQLLILHCSDTPLTSLPSLPSRLQQLYIDDTHITSLPILPHGLQRFSCLNTPFPQQHIDETMEQYIARFRSWQELQLSRERIQIRARLLKHELVADVWHPRRVQRIIDLCGEDVDFEML
jgi:hypothetical protein